MFIQVQIDRFRPDENDVQGISYMLFDEATLDRGIMEDDTIIVITPGGIRFAALDDYDPEHSTYFVQYTSPVLPEYIQYVPTHDVEPTDD